MNCASIMETLTLRGFVSQKSHEQLDEKLAKPMVVYAGFDPTADSLHIGNLLQIMLLAQFQRHGHKPIAVVGGATAMIGDPSGKSEERKLLDEETIQRNAEGIKKQLQHFLDFDNNSSANSNAAVLVNNNDWIGKFSFVEFLRDVGKYFRVGEMMGKESVRKRLNSSAGMSFTEFSYQLLQGYDFVHLSREYNCRLQVGGDDQWGNITAGIELGRKLDGSELYGLTSPLLTTADGKKFGKTESGTVWLDSKRTSPYEFYQYWMRCDDRDVIDLLKRFTFMPLSEIEELAQQVARQPEKRQAQQVLAAEVTRLVHGQRQLDLAQKASEILFGKEISGLSDDDLNSIFSDVPSSNLSRSTLQEGLSLIDALCQTKLCNSRGEAKKIIKSGGAYLNNQRISDIGYTLGISDLASQTVMILRTGKKKYHLLRFA